LGTRFSISLPLTLAVLDGMVVRVGDETIVVPLNTIAETLSIKAGDVRQLSQATNVLIVRDTLVPLFDLGAELGYRAPKSDFTGCVALLLTQDDLITAAIIVDTIDDQRQVVIKGLERNYGQVRGIAAATILGDGQIALILDPADLIGSSANHNSPVPSLKEAG
ncbi:MAG: chemotaxis protein CheW, partial [Pseudomonadota bacterium]